MSAVLFAATILEDGIATAVGGAAIGTTAGALAIAGTVLIILLAIVTAVLEGIRVFENAALPGKVAEYVVNARTTVTDPATLIDTTAGATSLFTMFVGATMPRPRYDVACDNSLIPPWAYTVELRPQPADLRAARPEHGHHLAGQPAGLPEPTADPARVAGRRPLPGDAARLGVAAAGGADHHHRRRSPTGTTQKVRLTGNWFVDAITEPGARTRAWQSLTLDYSTGTASATWPGWCATTTGRQTFIGGQAPADGTVARPRHLPGRRQPAGSPTTSSTPGPTVTSTPPASSSSATASGTPTYSPSAPIEAAPVTFSANDFEPGGLHRAPHLLVAVPAAGVRAPVPPQAPFPEFDGPFTGQSVSYTWQSNGRAKVELTASDPDGHSATSQFSVNVGNVAPDVVALHDNQTLVGNEITLQGVVSDAGQNDDLNIAINVGEGVQKSTKVGPNSIPFFDPDIDQASRSTRAIAGASWSSTPTPSRATTTAPTRSRTGAAAPTPTPSSSGPSASSRSPSPLSTTTPTASTWR